MLRRVRATSIVTMPWILFHVPTPTSDGRSARDLYEKRVNWITDEMRASAREHGCRFHQAWYASDESAFYALAFWTTVEDAQTFYKTWSVAKEPGEQVIRLEGDVGLVPLAGGGADV